MGTTSTSCYSMCATQMSPRLTAKRVSWFQNELTCLIFTFLTQRYVHYIAHGIHTSMLAPQPPQQSFLHLLHPTSFAKSEFPLLVEHHTCTVPLILSEIIHFHSPHFGNHLFHPSVCPNGVDLSVRQRLFISCIRRPFPRKVIRGPVATGRPVAGRASSTCSTT